MKTERAFTLLELLVAIAVVAILVALLLPVLSRGTQTAQDTVCTGNLRQLGLAAQMYWDNNGDRAFSYRFGAEDNGMIYWFGWLENGCEGRRRFDGTRGVMHPYLSGRGVETCPRLAYMDPRFKLKATGASYGYGYNLHLSGPLNGPAPMISTLENSSETVVFADAAQVNTFQSPASVSRPMIEEFYYVNATEKTAHFRHSQRVWAAFSDGHVEPESPVPGSLDERMPDQRVGQLKREKLSAK